MPNVLHISHKPTRPRSLTPMIVAATPLYGGLRPSTYLPLFVVDTRSATTDDDAGNVLLINDFRFSSFVFGRRHAREDLRLL